MKSLASSLIFALLFMSPVGAKPVGTDTEAVDAFRAIWRQTLGKQLEARPFIQHLKAQVFEDGKVTAHATTTTKALECINSTLSVQEEKELILFGKKSDLEPEKDVWVVSHSGDIGNGFQAVIDAKDGDLLFFWIVPEG